MNCFFLFSVGTLSLLSTSSLYGKEVVQNIIIKIIKMCFYDLHISSNAQPGIPMRNQKKKKKKKKKKKIRNGLNTTNNDADRFNIGKCHFVM